MSGEPVHIPVGVVVERRRAKSPWIDFVWQPVAVLAGAPEAEPWTMLEGDEERATYYAGESPIELHVTETANYRDNLATGAPLLWVVLRTADDATPYELFAVTADPAEGEAMTETGTDLVESVAMPDPIREQIARFVAGHHVERAFVKRKRDHADPETMSRHSRVEEKDG